ncbi:MULTISPECIES: copper chaperone PCu(A)C [Mycetohabitans]|uniref:Copper chaperone PCu(A)C n=1 Tax=Mycetohabitans rhizoxinica TaxID=412963 RepID=A0ABZ2PVY3_9BURK|nr:copper chaperone PCu(A)C [Mycetohabitans sp. B2]MCF7696173.1 copper chaperone PCu(A)C [Mycetohabitans sp. B2]
MRLLALLLTGVLTWLSPISASAKMPVSTDITSVEKSVWIRWLPNALPAAGYITLKNSSEQPVDVTKIKSPDYQNIAIYQTVNDAESSKMVKLDKFTIPAKGEFALVPGKYHLMFEKPTHLITPGNDARVIFFLSDGKVFKVKMPVRTSPELY